jgi:phospholipid/cholesterol/gamma-HCH transport system substrate-binding protein
MVSVRTKIIEIGVGAFIFAAIVAALILALKVSGLSNMVSQDSYQISAVFDNIGDLKIRAPVTVSGVKIGQVMEIKLDPNTYKAIVTLAIDQKANNIPVDSSASILTQGLLGANYISLTPGFEESFLKNGDRIETTHSALILENLIGQMLFKLNKGNS